jgi:hypothetical protein
MDTRRAATDLPKDFPRGCGGALSGAHPKLSVTRVDGTFVASPSDDELLRRYLACEDLASQLIALARRKRPRYAELPLKDFLRRFRQGVLHKRWDIDTDELTWVMRQVCFAVGGTDDDVPVAQLSAELQVLPGAALRQLPLATPIESIVDRALRALDQGLPISRPPPT